MTVIMEQLVEKDILSGIWILLDQFTYYYIIRRCMFPDWNSDKIESSKDAS